MNKIGIIGAGTLPTEVLRMAKEANVEIVELDKDYSPTDIPQFEDRVYTIQPRPEIPNIEWLRACTVWKGWFETWQEREANPQGQEEKQGSKNSSTKEITYYISHVTVNKHQRLRSR